VGKEIKTATHRFDDFRGRSNVLKMHPIIVESRVDSPEMTSVIHGTGSDIDSSIP
jgi:hypothetical protein